MSNKIEQKGKGNIALIDSTVIINELNGRTKSPEHSNEDNSKAFMTILIFGIVMAMPAYLIHQKFLITTGYILVGAFFGLTIFQLVRLSSRNIFVGLNWKSKLSIIWPIFHWSGLGVILYLLESPFYNSKDLLNVKMQIIKNGYFGIFPRTIELAIKYTPEVLSISFQILSYGLFLLMAFSLILAHLGFIFSIVNIKQGTKGWVASCFKWLDQKFLKFKVDRHKVIGNIVLLTLAFLMSSGLTVEFIQHAQNQNQQEMNDFLKKVSQSK
ncbi:hypothetical protein [Brevibacillus brevis]|uniref:hypothetical protein n=1 Tax=Brevibacillus brevis TaxID=1393 RepID=UPI00165DE733|nr:hypothetical protein [Brevibacillus brevis]